MRRLLREFAVITGLLTGLAMAAPSYLADHAAPRSAFLVLPETAPEPQIAVTVSPLASGHLRLSLDVTHFQFTELCLVEADTAPIGHAHIIVDGVKLGSAFQPITDLEPLPKGRHEITVQLRAQDHRALLGRDGLIQARVVVEVE